MAEYDKNLEYISQTQTLVGQKKRELVDTQTGEVIWVDQITKRTYGTKNFWKCYLMDFLTVLGIIDSKQLDVFIYIPRDKSCYRTMKARSQLTRLLSAEQRRKRLSQASRNR